MDFLPDIEKFKNFFDGTDSKNEISIAVEEAKKYDIFNLTYCATSNKLCENL